MTNEKTTRKPMETFEEYLKHYYARETIKSYLYAIDHFLFYFRDERHIHYTDIIDYFSNEHYRRPRDVSAVKSYFNYLIETGQREDHPCVNLRLNWRKKDVQFQELFSSEELETLMQREERYELLTLRNRAVISLLIYQALTPANIERLRISDLNIDEGSLYVRATPKLTRRTLELKPKQFHLLYRYVQEVRPKLLKEANDSLFIGKLGTSFKVDTLNKMLLQFQPMFPGRTLNARIIRKSVIANWLNEKQIPLEDVQQLSGQKWLSTTEKYVRPNTEERRDMINQFFPL